jgi:NAD(P)-dependent dehydrogenase (short-subunit alcohol dehydrogenase family)
MENKVVLITGALTGIGRATAFTFAQAGYHVVVSGRRDEAGEALASELRAQGARAEFVRADVRFEEEVRHLVDHTVDVFGRLDVAVNNAGTEGVATPISEQDPQSYAAIFDSNVLGTLLSLKHEMRVMVAQGSGSIVNISSVRGHTGAVNGSVYGASKHAVNGLTKCAALEGAPYGVQVNAVAPGPIDTEMLKRFTGDNQEVKDTLGARVPLGRVGRPEEMGHLILFLSSSGSSYITGQIITADGGITVG